jgi:uncharacterized protein YbbK (DUF523 family)
MTEPVRIAISSCLLGERVRYDGESKLQSWLDDCGEVLWVPVCPEVEIGMSIPREAIQIEESCDGIKLLGVESRQDWTEPMNDFTRQRVLQLQAAGIVGYIFKARSPSCGIGDVPLMGALGQSVVGKTNGRFCDVLMEMWPELPIVNEVMMLDVKQRMEFLQRVQQNRVK